MYPLIEATMTINKQAQQIHLHLHQPLTGLSIGCTARGGRGWQRHAGLIETRPSG